jgi:hypothetical protein
LEWSGLVHDFGTLVHVGFCLNYVGSACGSDFTSWFSFIWHGPAWFNNSHAWFSFKLFWPSMDKVFYSKEHIKMMVMLNITSTNTNQDSKHPDHLWPTQISSQKQKTARLSSLHSTNSSPPTPNKASNSNHQKIHPNHHEN